jgi:hypothetical protein
MDDTECHDRSNDGYSTQNMLRAITEIAFQEALKTMKETLGMVYRQ